MVLNQARIQVTSWTQDTTINANAPMTNAVKETPAKRTVFISLVTRSYKTIVKMYGMTTLYSFPRPPIKLNTPVRNSMGRLTEYDKTPPNSDEINSS